MYLDLHQHTINSDGLFTPRELVLASREVGITMLAITDHNYATDLEELRKEFPDMTLITGTEMSAVYTKRDGSKTEVHVVSLGFDPKNEGMQALIARNRPDRRPYIEKILAALRACGVDLGTYEYLRDKYSKTFHLGRGHVAAELVEQGYAKDADEAFDEYIGAFGKRRAYVKSGLEYADLETVIRTVHAAGGCCVLAHLYYYRMDEAEQRALLDDFKGLGGDGMEVFYGAYNEAQTEQLSGYADLYGLMYSAGSDHHGRLNEDRLDHGFLISDCAELVGLLG